MFPRGALWHYPTSSRTGYKVDHPNQANQGETLNVIITGYDFTEANAVSFGTVIGVNSFTVDSPTQMTANITIAADATIGAKDVSATTAGGRGGRWKLASPWKRRLKKRAVVSLTVPVAARRQALQHPSC